jgi:hypothetical protein
MHLAINKVRVVLGVVVVCNEERVFQLKGALAWWYQLQRILLDLGVQPLMLSIMVVEGFRLINVNLKPCSYETMTLMGMSKRARGLTKHEVVINKLANLYHNVGPNDGYTCYILWYSLEERLYTP